MSVFLIDDKFAASYDKLLKDINGSDFYYQAQKSDSLYELYLNFIIALCADKDITLIDSDLSETEYANLDQDRLINEKSDIQINTITSFNELVERILNSTSLITIFTSGTTGQPKKINHSVSTLVRAVRRSDDYNSQVWGFAYNPTHIAGLQVFFQALLNGNTIVNIFNKRKTEVYQAIDSYAITNISATPTFYRLLLPFEKPFSTIRRITFGGEKSNDKLHHEIQKVFPNAKINNIYASTEAGSLLVSKGENFIIPEHLKDKVILDDDELLIHKSLLGESQGINFDGDFYRSGDLIEWVDKSKGLFKFLSRKNELINVGGYKVNPSEVEAAISELPGVQQVIVYGKANSVLGNVLCAEIQKREGEVLEESEIRFFLTQKLQDFKIPRRIKFVETLALTRTGKLKR